MWVVIAALALGHELSVRLWRDRPAPPGPLQRASSTILIGTVAWLGSSWLLALIHLLTLPALVARTLIFAAIAVMLWLRRQKEPLGRDQIAKADAIVVIGVLLPLILWTVFILWRGVVVPPLSHDAVSYHLPKAVLYSRAHGFDPLNVLNAHIRSLPANYEILLADVVTVDRSDTYTEWIGTYFFLAFLVASAALIERWWRDGLLALNSITVFIATCPVLLLHSGAHKNDVMTAFFMVAMLTWAGRWLSEADMPSLLLLLPSVAAAIGTKPQSAGLAACLAPLVIWRMFRERVRFATWIRLTLVFAVCLLLLGGAVYATNALSAGKPLSVGLSTKSNAMVTYGDWKNLWRGPYVLLAAPFSGDPMSLRVPWAAQPWFLPRYEIYFSHLGVPFALCALALPLCVLAFRRDVPEAQRERMLMSLAAAVTFAAMLPVLWTPDGFYPISLPRFSLFLLPVVFGWTVVPLVRRLVAANVSAARMVVMAGGLCGAWYAVDFALHDRFATLDYVLWARARPGTRSILIDPYRAASVMDRLAGPRDRIAMDAGYGAWIHPAFGAQLERPVTFIDLSVPTATIPDDVDWVVVDHSWGAIWGDPDFKSLADWKRYLERGRASEPALRPIQRLLTDKRFRPVMIHRRAASAVFRRVR